MKNETENLALDQLEAVTGGKTAATARYVNVTCEHCGAKGQHLMNTGWSALCRVCGKTINLKAQGGE